jgi:hypothetical protein
MVPSDLRLDRLHLTLQATMGWQNMHLYEFAAGPLRWGLPHPDYDHVVLPARRTSVQDALAAAGSARLIYTYDFGDNWHHRITTAPTDGSLPGQLYPRLVDAQGRCPPEDVGGTPGYEHFLNAIANPRHPDHEDLLEWHGGPFDPAVPPTDELQLDILKLAKRWKPKKQ